MTENGGGTSNKTKINYKKDLNCVDFDSKNRTIGEAFKQYLNVNDSNKIQQATFWFLNEFDILKHIDILDTKRSFDVKQKQNALINQKFLCFIDEKPLTYAEAESSHIKAYSKGGKTQKNNLYMVRKKHNKDMGTMNVLTYKEYYNKQKINSDNNSYNNGYNNLTIDTSPNTAVNGHASL